MAVMDSAFGWGKETVYGTPVTCTRGLETKDDGWQKKTKQFTGGGFRAAAQGRSVGRVKGIPQGAEGSAKFELPTAGLVGILDAAIGSSSGPTGAGAAKTYVFTTTSGSPNVSWTAQMVRSDNTGALQAFTYPGAKVSKWDLTAKVGSMIEMAVDFVAAEERVNIAAGSFTYPAIQTFDYGMCVVKINGVAVDWIDEVKISFDHSIKDDRTALRGSYAAKEGVRVDFPKVDVTIKGEFKDLTEYNKIASQTTSNLTLEITGPLISGADYHKVTIALSAVQWFDGNPKADMGNLTSLDMKGVALYDGTNPLCQWTVVTTDVAL